jgi:hypothetical protein
MAPFIRDHSEASLVTVRPSPMTTISDHTFSSGRATAGSEDVIMQDAVDLCEDNSNRKHFIVGVDFGTTFSSVSVLTYDNRNKASSDQIQSILNYPYDPRPSGVASNEVPTEIRYPDSSSVDDEWWNEPDTPRSNPSVDDESDDESVDELSEDEVVHDPTENISNFEQPTSRPMPENAKWGYSIWQNIMFRTAHDFTDPRHIPISRFKLLLSKDKSTRKVRETLRPTLRGLRKAGLIERDEDLIADYLTCLFKFVKEELRQNHSLQEDSPIELVPCVPAIWGPKAGRQMQSAMLTAMRRTGFGSITGNAIDNLFFVCEPEAAAAYVLSEKYSIMV